MAKGVYIEFANLIQPVLDGQHHLYNGLQMF